MTRALLLIGLLAIVLAGCGWQPPCVNIGSGCPPAKAEPIKPAPEPSKEET